MRWTYLPDGDVVLKGVAIKVLVHDDAGNFVGRSWFAVVKGTSNNTDLASALASGDCTFGLVRISSASYKQSK